MRTRTIILMCMLVLGTGVTAQASPLKAEASRYAAASVPTLSVNDFESDKQNLYGVLENVLSSITAVENKLISLAIPKDERVWDMLAQAKAEYAYCKDILDAADSEARLMEVNVAIESLQVMVTKLQNYAKALEQDWLDEPIVFADSEVERICLDHWDGIRGGNITDEKDGKLTHGEAAEVTSLDNFFRGANIASFDELMYFTGLTSIPEQAFEGCTSLTRITLPYSVKNIDKKAFAGCNQLQKLGLSSNILSIAKNYGEEAFSNINPGTIDLTIDCVPGHPMIVDELFYGLSQLKSVTLGDGITGIGEKAFFDCGGLESVSMTTSVQTIGSYAFGNTADELSFQIGASSGSKTIADNLFEGIKMKAVTLDDAITRIGDSAFQNCSELTEVRLPSHVSVIKAYAFSWCTKLSKVTMSTALEFIEYDAFKGCINLTLYIEPTATKTTFGGTNSGGNAIMPFPNSLGSIVAVEVMEGVTAIESLVFSSSHSIWQVTLPSTVTEIGSHSFSGSSDLEEVVLKDGLKKIGLGAFGGCEKLKSVAVPASVNYIENGAFQGCTSLVEANLPAGLEFVGAQLFKNSGLSHISIPASVTKIWSEAFAGCTDLRDVTLEQDDPTKIEIDGDPFPAPHSGISLHVPFWSQSDYKADGSYWKDFYFIGFDECVVDNMLYVVYPNTDVPFAILQHPVDKLLTAGEVTIPAEITVHGQTFQVTDIAGNAFKDCSNLTGIKLNTALESVISGAFDGLQDIVITINPYGDQTIVKPNLFKDYYATGSFTVVLGEGITKVGDKAFNNCENLKALYLPASLESFGEFAFTQVNNLMDVYVKWESPLDIPYNDRDPFFNGNLNSGEKIRLHVPIGKYSTYTYHPYWGKYFDIPNDNDWVGDFVYSPVANADHELMVLQYAGQPSGSEVMAVIPETVEKNGITYRVTEVGGDIFANLPTYNYVNNVYLTIPESVNKVNGDAFKWCKNITVIVKWQEPLALYGLSFDDMQMQCESHKLLVPVGTTSKYESSDWSPFSMFEEYIPFADNLVEEICLSNLDGQPSGPKDGVVSVFEARTAETLPNVDWFAWTKIKSFDELKYFTKLTTIVEYAFSHCDKLERITIPRSVTQIGRDAFWFCSSLKTVTLEWDTPIEVDSSNDPFPSKDGITLLVPEGKKSAYQSHSYWQQFFIAEARDGDANGNGGVDIDDALAIVNYILGQPSDGFVEANADVNGDGKITIADAVSLVKMILEMP